MFKRSLRALAAIVGATAFSYAAAAQDLAIGLAGTLTSLDPHMAGAVPNADVSLHLFDRLITKDEQLRLQPGLATAWIATDATTWEFRLRRGVKFHNGQDFAAEDVVANLQRISKLDDQSPLRALSRRIAAVDVIDAGTIRIRTTEPFPLLPYDLSSLAIVPRRFEQAASTDFNGGRALDGTGPYRFIEHVPGDRILLARNDAYWGPKPQWSRVLLKFIPNDAARVAALQGEEVQIIDQAPPALYAKLKTSPDIELSKRVGNRVIYLALDSHREQSPYVTDKSGALLPNNPLRDPRVRKALSKAVNRPAIVDKLMDGLAIAAGGVLADEVSGGAQPKVEAFDPEGAKRLLAEAGYPNGFGLTIHGPNDRYVNDEKVLQTIGPMFGRIGIDTRVITQPWSAYVAQMGAPNYAYSVMLSGWAAETGELSSPLRGLLATPDRLQGFGEANRGRYSSPKFDGLLRQALALPEDAKRNAKLREAVELAMGDTAVIPIDYPVNVWAMRKGYSYPARADDFTLAQSVTKN